MDATITSAAAPGRRRRTSGVLVAMLGFFGSIWMGIILASTLFVYCTIGSAIPAVRQLPLLEMTEFEWFHWWPFNLIVGMFAASLTVTTVRRIPFRPVNFGVWMIHTGIIVLTLGSYYYFSTKIEGDAPVFRRRVRIDLPGQTETVTLVALPGNETTVTDESGRWGLRIQSTNSNWPILSDPHKGEKAYAINIMVTPPDGDPFVRQLLDGYPQYTEDIIPGKGRAIKAIGRKLVREQLTLSLEYEPQEYFHVMQTWAIYVRRVGETHWHQRPIRNMPRYNDRIGSRDQVYMDRHDSLPLRTLDLTVPSAAAADPLKDASVHVTGYLRYAQMQGRWHEGGETLNPVLHANLLTDNTPTTSVELMAFDRTRSRDAQGLMEFVWLDRFSEVASLPTESAAELGIVVPGKDVSLTIAISPETIAGHLGRFTPIEGTEFSYRIRSLQDNLMMPGGRGSVSIAIVDIKTPEGQFTRWVADKPQKSRDLEPGGQVAHGVESGFSDQLDPRLHMTYHPRSAPIILAGYPGGLYLAVNGHNGRELGRDIEVGEMIEIVPGLRLQIDSLLTHATLETRPFVVPQSRRRANAGELFSMIRLEVSTERGRQVQWMPYNQYAFPDAQYAYSGRFSFAPVTFRGADGKPVEILFSRERRKLPHPVALDHFELDTHVGGFTGAALTIRNYISKLRFLDGETWTDVRAIKVNAPTEYGGYWYFQSTWDKPASGDPQGGMNYTGLGVGNRNGVYIQLAGCCLAVSGMIFAFYIKPLIKRRRAGHQRNKIADKSVVQEKPLETIAS